MKKVLMWFVSWFIVIFIVLGLLSLVFFKPLTAIFIYHDLRCILVECRILK